MGPGTISSSSNISYSRTTVVYSVVVSVLGTSPEAACQKPEVSTAKFSTISESWSLLLFLQRSSYFSFLKSLLPSFLSSSSFTKPSCVQVTGLPHVIHQRRFVL